MTTLAQSSWLEWLILKPFKVFITRKNQAARVDCQSCSQLVSLVKIVFNPCRGAQRLIHHGSLDQGNILALSISFSVSLAPISKYTFWSLFLGHLLDIIVLGLE